MAKVTYRTEDEIRDEAKSILGFDKKESKFNKAPVKSQRSIS